ncbi:MAG TPA: ABC transporter substrate-binding protein [Chitinispirillaceae bacterium]|nr:ABC transporter substrate-binding protein [Chitinispirillaceae bacterium]
MKQFKPVKSILVMLFTLIYCILSLVRCTQQIAPQGGAISGVDDVGRVISLEKPAHRIVLMTGSPTDAIFALGAGDRIIAITDNYRESYPATVSKFPALLNLPGIGTRSAPNVEAILALKPDLILVSGSGENPEKNAIALKKVGLPYAVMKSFENIEDSFGQIERLGVFLGKKLQGELIAEGLKKRIDATAILTRTVSAIPVRVFFWWGTGNGTYGDSTAVNELIARAGGINIAARNGKRFFDCSPEYVVNSDPEVIVYSYWREQDRESRLEQLRNNPHYNKISAVRNGRIYAIDGHLLHSSILLPEALDSLIHWVHPELFTLDQMQTDVNNRTIVDDCERAVPIPVNPGKIVCLATADVEILSAIGASSRLAGIPDGVKFPPTILSIERIGGMYGRFNVEKIVGRTPDLVLMTISGWGQYRKHLDQLEKHHVTTLGLQYPRTFDDLINHIRRLGYITGESGAAAVLTDSLLCRRNVILEKTQLLDSSQRPRVYMEWISEGGRGSTYGKKERNHEIITVAGGYNIFADRQDVGSFTASDEEVISRNPQVIIITADTTRNNAEKIHSIVRERAGWLQTDAVNNNRIYIIDAQLTWANPRLIEGIEQCARIIHPELFK